MNKTVIKSGGFEAAVINYGAILQSLKLNGNELVVGHSSEEEYIKSGDSYFGATVGRTCNRTGKLNYIDGEEYELDLNERGVNNLHGGFGGLSRKIWDVTENGDDFVRLECVSPDGEDKYPGNLKVTAEYRLTPEGIIIRHTAETDRPTWVALTNHSYFNLDSFGKKDVFGTRFLINADESSAYDNNARVIGRRGVQEAFGFNTKELSILDRDFDDNFYISSGETIDVFDRDLFFAAFAEGEYAELAVYTDLPCIQFYTGGFIPGGTVLSGGRVIGKSAAFCLESQFEPGAPSRGECVLRPGDKYDHVTFYKIGVAKRQTV